MLSALTDYSGKTDPAIFQAIGENGRMVKSQILSGFKRQLADENLNKISITSKINNKFVKTTVRTENVKLKTKNKREHRK